MIGIDCERLCTIVFNRAQSHGSDIVNKGLRVVKENSNLAEWTRQVEKCRNSGLSVRKWCEQKGIAQSTYTYRQNKVWKAINQRSNTFVEMSVEESSDMAVCGHIAATVHTGGVNAEIHNGADEATLTALLRALRSC